MAFANINKITLQDTSDVKENISGVVLLVSSLIYDCVQEKNYREALHHLGILKCSVENLEYVLKDKHKGILNEFKSSI